MDFTGDFGLGFGQHEHHYFPESGDRLRYIKTPAQANQKWVSGTSAGTSTWLTNLQGTTKPITQGAVNARALMQANWNAATAPGGIWEQHLLAVGDAGVKAAAQAKQQNYATGTQQASAKQLAAITKIIAYEQAGLSQLTPKGTVGAGRLRLTEWFDYMSAGRGSLGA